MCKEAKGGGGGEGGHLWVIFRDSVSRRGSLGGGGGQIQELLVQHNKSDRGSRA
jgi:hypothetical protein